MEGDSMLRIELLIEKLHTDMRCLLYGVHLFYCKQ